MDIKNFQIWGRYAVSSFQRTLSNRVTVGIFFTAKFLRIALFLIFLVFLFRGTANLAGYNREQIIFFYLSFQLIETLAQFFFRGVYSFRGLITTGDFDFVLVKPISPLIGVLLGSPDIMDLMILLPLAIATVWFSQSAFHPSLLSWMMFFLLIINGLIISAALHIIVLALGIITYSIDHLVLIYRDLTSLLRIPSDIYVEPIRFIITFLIPLGIMITFPPKVLIGLLSFKLVLLSIAIGVLAIFLGLKFWHYSLKYYQSASS